MAIVIRLVGERYEALVTSAGGDARWRSDVPMGVDELIDALRAVGCHQTDIGDAFQAADPDWLSR